MPVQGLVDTSLQEARSRLAEEAGDVPYCNTLRELSPGVPTPKEEDDDRRECRFEEPDHKAECVHLVAGGRRCLSESERTRSVSISSTNFQETVFAHVNTVHPSSQNKMQYRGRILSAIQVEGTCIMAKEMV